MIKRKLKFDGYENSLEATQLENKINNEKNGVTVGSLRENYKKSHKKQ